MPSRVPFERTAKGVPRSASSPVATSAYAGRDFTRSGSMPAASTMSGSGRKPPDAVACQVHGTTVLLNASSSSPRSKSVPNASNAMPSTSTASHLPGFPPYGRPAARFSSSRRTPKIVTSADYTPGPEREYFHRHGRNDDTHLATGDSPAYPPAGPQPSPGGSPPPQDCIPRRMDRAVDEQRPTP